MINAFKGMKDLMFDECDLDFKKLVRLLNSENISYVVDTNLVRGLDYYSKTAWIKDLVEKKETTINQSDF